MTGSARREAEDAVSTSRALGVFRRVLDDPAAAGLLQLRPKSLDEESAFDGNDYDFLSDTRIHEQLLWKFQTLAKSEGVSFLFDEAHSSKTHVQLWDSGRGCAIEIDLWKEHVVCPASSGAARYLRHEDLRGILVRGDGDPRGRLPVDVEWLLYVVHLETGAKDLGADAVRARLRHYGGLLRENTDEPTHDPKLRARLIEQVAELESPGAEPEPPGAESESPAANLKKLAAESFGFLVQLGVHCRPRPLEDDFGIRVRNAVRRRIHARLHHPIVAFVGPDGSGKTTIIDALRSDDATAGELRIFKHFFRMTRPYAFVSARHPAYRTLDDNLADEQLSVWWFWVACIQYQREMKRGASRGRVYLDRYFHDLLIQDVRRGGGRARLGFWRRGWVGAFPLPDAVVQLSAPEETLRSRKQEISVDNIRRYEGLVERMYARRRPRLRAFVSTQDSLESCLAFLGIVLRRVGDGAPDGAS